MALQHGCRSKSAMAGKLPKGFAELQQVVDGFYDGWVSDAGGLDNLTHAKRALLLVSKGCLAIWLLGLEHLSSASGLVDEKGEVHSVTNVMGTFANTMRLNLVAAGLERQARTIGGSALEAKFAEIAEREAAKEQNETENGIQSDSRPTGQPLRNDRTTEDFVVDDKIQTQTQMKTKNKISFATFCADVIGEPICLAWDVTIAPLTANPCGPRRNSKSGAR